MGTKENPGRFDCYANAAPDEPMFILLARDKHAPTLVWLWATLRELDGEPEEVVGEARALCVQMMEWATDHNRTVVGLGQAVLAGAMELIRAANHGVKNAKNGATTEEIVRLYLTKTEFEQDGKS